ncbi:MAG TPA: CPBP family intramembrane glutamic endopeptidase [Kofleriaceae bacterium]|nr:CPBP family intramembrane glutamic endopeptidase [Kofleriaceae bacterium]
MTEPLVGAPACAVCGRALKLGAEFCGGCGQRVILAPRRSDVRTLITFYVTSLVIMASAMIYVRVTDDELHGVIGATLGLTVASGLFAVQHRDLVALPLRTAGFSLVGYALVVLASVPIVLGVHAYVGLVHRLLGMHITDELAVFAGSPAWLPIVMVVVLPPLGEELAFRGLIFGGLRRSLSVTDAFLISSFAFAVLHLAIPSLVTHFPLGLYLCWLRHRSGSLWPGVLAHACHNLGICILAWT